MYQSDSRAASKLVFDEGKKMSSEPKDWEPKTIRSPARTSEATCYLTILLPCQWAKDNGMNMFAEFL